MKKWMIGVLVVFFLFVGYMSSQESTPKQTVVHGLSDFSYTQIEKGMIYEAKEMTVVDIYAETTKDGKTAVEYYLVVFRDANNRMIAASMPVEPFNGPYFRLHGYINDDSMVIGDCVLNCYVRVSGVSESATNQMKLKEFFADAVSHYTEFFGEPLYPLEYQLDYYCAIGEDPLAKK